jgi:hypothetical protein
MHEQETEFDSFWKTLSLAERKIIGAVARLSFRHLGVTLADLEEVCNLDVETIESVANKLRDLGYMEKGRMSGRVTAKVTVVDGDNFFVEDKNVSNSMKIVRSTMEGDVMLKSYQAYKDNLDGQGTT